MAMSPRLDVALHLIESARAYMLQLIADVDDSQWFTIPPGASTHLAWQVGHLAMAEYGLTMIRMRGKEPSDADFITNAFMRTFKKGSTPQPDPSLYPAPEEIRQTLADVHAQALRELPGYDDSTLDEPLPEPYAGFATRLGSLYFCAAHEMLHAGQIGALRRMLGKDPLR
ncbi:MAG: DinB family protein [Planctomycetales bacterium]|nr:DinB family protein [Planctomycetales bacterium]